LVTRARAPQLLAVEHEVEGRDPAPDDREPDDCDDLVAGGNHDPFRALDERRPGQMREPAPAGEHLPRDRLGSDDGWPCARIGRARICPEDDVRIEHRDEPFEVAGTRGREKGVDDPALKRLAGALFPISALPGFLTWVARFLPLTHGLALMRYGLLSDSSGLHGIWKLTDPTAMAALSLAVVGVFAVALTPVSVRAFTRAALR